MDVMSSMGSSSASSQDLCADPHRGWANEAFESLGDKSGKLTIARLRSRQFGSWIRTFLADMLAGGELPPMKRMQTSRIVSLLIAKAEVNDGSCLTVDEFDAFTRVIVGPPAGSLEASIVWALFDTGENGEIQPELIGRLASVCAGLLGGGSATENLPTTEGEALKPEAYRAWLAAMPPPAPRSARGPPSGRPPPPRPMSFPSRIRATDQTLRSAEAEELSLFKPSGRDQPLDLSEVVRSLAPSHRTQRKRPGRLGTAEAPAEEATPRTPRLPPVTRKPIDFEAQEEWNERREARLLPFMKVKASYIAPGGAKIDAVGTLITGWGCSNVSSTVPHSKPPDSVRSARAPPPAHTLKQAARWKDVDNFVVVQIHGIERLVPRAWVSPAAG